LHRNKEISGKREVRSEDKRRNKLPKLKTHRGAAKRFKKTATGKIKRSKAYKSHLLTGKSSKRTRQLRKSRLVDKTNLRTVKKLLPY
jgi:large subunit ribosomal protein L35